MIFIHFFRSKHEEFLFNFVIPQYLLTAATVPYIMGLDSKFKQVIVIRTDLNMKVGKKCAQACHASLSAAEVSKSKNIETYRNWKRQSGQRKIVLKIDSEEAIKKLYHDVMDAGIGAFLVQDAGLTQLEPGTITALGIGPDTSVKIDKFCGDLKLL
jgi:PTH2 family peptidyl-tRNA hydrolase